MAVQGYVRLCMAVHGWSRPYGCGLAFAVVHQGSTNYTVLELPLFCTYDSVTLTLLACVT